jgi:predicted alpha/beta superfamily hydrolase
LKKIFTILLNLNTFLGIVFLTTDGFSQHRISFILEAPKAVDGDTSFFLAANANGWKPSDSLYRFKLVNGKWQLSILYTRNEILEYKITRGHWDKAEVSASGSPLPNRKLEVNRDTSVVIRVEAWSDRTPRKHTASMNVKIMQDTFPMQSLKDKRRVTIYLPPDYQKGKKRYPVIYMHDAQNLFDEYTAAFGVEWKVDETLDMLWSKYKKSCIVIGIDNGPKRINEYLAYPNERFKPSLGDEYVEFIVKELKPYVDSVYRTKRESRYTAIAGSSMGALISLYAITTYPEIFGSAALLSGSYWLVPDIEYRMTTTNRNAYAKYYLSAGDKESNTLVKETDRVAKKLQSLTEGQVKLRIIQEGKHQEQYWQQPFADYVYWWLKK